MTTFSVFLTNTPAEAELISSCCGKIQILDLIEREPSRYSVDEWDDDNNLIETLNGEEWLEKYTYLTKPRRVLY